MYAHGDTKGKRVAHGRNITRLGSFRFGIYRKRFEKGNNKMRIIIAGDGKVGLALTRLLSQEGHDLVAIDSNRAVLELSLIHI